MTITRPVSVPSAPDTGKEGAPGTPWQVRMGALAAIWGSSFVLIKLGDEALAPLQVALGRVLFGGAALLLILAVRREKLPRDLRLWGHLAVLALLFNAGPFTLFAYGETRTTSVLAGIWNATTPLLTLLVVMAVLPEERPTRQRVTGLLLGFAGVLVVLGVWQGFGGQALLGNLACLGAACCYGLGFPYARRQLSGRPESVVSLSAAQLLCAAVELLLVVPLVSGVPTGVSWKAAGAVLVLGVLGTGIAYVLNYGLIRDTGATTASTVAYVIPLFSTVEGILFLGEPLGWNEPLGAALVILGVAVSQGRLTSLMFRRPIPIWRA